MATATAATEACRHDLQVHTHASCYACRPAETGGLGLCFTTRPDGSVVATWSCPSDYQSYDGILHGGIIATLLDGAMVHALFARDIVAHTAELKVRYRHPVAVGLPVQITAQYDAGTGPLHQLTAEIFQNRVVCAHATAKFMQAARPPSDKPHATS